MQVIRASLVGGTWPFVKVLGISPFEKNATACLMIDRRVAYAIAEERLGRVKIRAGFPYISPSKKSIAVMSSARTTSTRWSTSQRTGKRKRS